MNKDPLASKTRAKVNQKKKEKQKKEVFALANSEYCQYVAMELAPVRATSAQPHLVSETRHG